MTDRLHRCEQRLAQLHGRITVVLQQMKGNPLRRARPDAGQMLQGIDQPVERRAKFHEVNLAACVRDPAGRTCTRCARKCVAGFGRPGARHKFNSGTDKVSRIGAVLPRVRRGASSRAAAAYRR